MRRVGSALRHELDRGNAAAVDQIGNYQRLQINRYFLIRDPEFSTD